MGIMWSADLAIPLPVRGFGAWLGAFGGRLDAQTVTPDRPPGEPSQYASSATRFGGGYAGLYMRTPGWFFVGGGVGLVAMAAGQRVSYETTPNVAEEEFFDVGGIASAGIGATYWRLLARAEGFFVGSGQTSLLGFRGMIGIPWDG